MKITLEPETDEEEAVTKTITVSGLRTVGFVGMRLENDVVPRPVSHAYFGTDGHEMRALLTYLDTTALRYQQKLDAATDNAD